MEGMWLYADNAATAWGPCAAGSASALQETGLPAPQRPTRRATHGSTPSVAQTHLNNCHKVIKVHEPLEPEHADDLHHGLAIEVAPEHVQRLPADAGGQSVGGEA